MANEEHVKRLKRGFVKWNSWRRISSEVPDLSWANLSGADLQWANLGRVHLNGADLNKANLAFANLKRASLSGANLSQVTLGWTVFADVDLLDAKGLDTVEHVGPSTIGIDTVYQSGGKIPEVFLRRVGIPEPFIVQMKAIVGAMERIQFYSCFIAIPAKTTIY